MSGKTELSRVIFEKLINHLVNIEEDKNNLLQEYFPVPSKERDGISYLLEKYIAKIDHLIRNDLIVVQSSDNSFPFVAMYCEVEVQDLENGEIEKLRIVPPFKNDESNDVSFLSPAGKALLLKNIGDETVVKAPGGESHYRIKTIKLRYP
ncbi:MAG: hypothetical protein JL50_20595 [Peptococcaceae bacterium BICA1-7]|nr:MAG: hypothetical protein JL50_20595 [Peptococcaceae bacterium BICA1-7]HBV98481.1 transcription elongation factor GreAB [Desulfotomaculum sp.]